MNIGSVVLNFLNMTAWRMDTPELFGSFHIIASLICIALAVSAAALIARRAEKERHVRRALVSAGLILMILETYKQTFLYFVVNGGAFDCWYFPFQLCSVPMYLCILLPVLKAESRVKVMTFIGGYGFISAAAALIYPEDILRPYISLTVHGFVWHGLLLFISLLIFMTGCIDTSPGGLKGAAVIFVILGFIAVNINIVAEPVMPAIRAQHPAISHDWAAMFYLNPFHISPQPIVGTVQEAIGIPAGLLLYMIAICAAGSLTNILFSKVVRKSVIDDADEED